MVVEEGNGVWRDQTCTREFPFVCRRVCGLPETQPTESPTRTPNSSDGSEATNNALGYGLVAFVLIILGLAVYFERTKTRLFQRRRALLSTGM